jgi:2-dehydropantoate 2-reductase
MKIAVIGAGGVGGYFGGRLAQAGVDTTFIVRRKTWDVLRVDSINGDFVVERPQVTDDPASVGPVDAILVAVKAWQLPELNLAPMIGKDTVVVPLENGIDAPDVLSELVGRDHVAGGLCAIVSFLVEPGHVKHASFDPMVMLGELDHRRSERLERLREAFLRANVNAEIPPDIHHSMWTKFLFIATLSGIGALTRAPVGVWRNVPEVRELADTSLREVVALATARGVDLGHDPVAKTWERYDAMPPASTSSMQRDIMEGKPSELDAQLGAIVRLARENGVPVPVTSFVYNALLPQERVSRGIAGDTS